MGDELLEINRTLGNIEGKLDSLQDRFDAYTIKHDQSHRKIDKEIDTIQADVNKAKGATTIVGIVAGGIGATLTLVVALAVKYLGGGEG